MMKKLIALIILLALALSGCAGKPDAQTDSEAASGGETAAEQPAEAHSGELVLLESGTSAPIWYCGSSASGSCKLEPAGTDYPDWQRLVYYDYAAATKRPVCAKEGCAHTDPSCEAFSKTNVYQPQSIYNYGDDIVFVNHLVPLAEEIVGGEVRPVGIEVCRADGSARRTLVSYNDRMEPINNFPNDGERFYSYSDEALARIEPGKGPVAVNGLLCDGRYLWYHLAEIEKGEDGLPYLKKSIVKLDYATGDQVGKVATQSKGYDLLGVWLGRLLSYGVPFNSDGGRSFPLSYYATDLDTGVMQTVYSGEVNMDVDADDGLGVYLTGGKIYQSRPDEHALYKLNESGDMEKVMDVPESWARFYLHDYGDTLLFGVTEGESSKQYLCDDLGGELRSFAPLTYQPERPGSAPQALPICGETEDEFFVFIDSNKTVAEVLESNGELAKREIYTFNYGMIKQSDYWAANAVFRDFTEVA